MIRFTDVVPDAEPKKKAAPAADPKPPAPAAVAPKPAKAPRKAKTSA